MKENTFSEHDSLELIAQMIRQSKKNMEVGSGNILLYYGYPVVLLSVAVYLLIHFTGKPIWHTLWFLMFVPAICIGVNKKKSEVCVVTHMDKAINSIWSILGQLFFLTVIGIVILGYFTGSFNFILMLPLSLLYAGIGIAITGIITDFKWMVYTPLVAFAVAIYMLVSMIANIAVADWWNLLFGVSFLVMMVIPGHLLNHKIKEPCLKN